MMGQIYNFDEIIDRTQTDSAKWSINQQLFGKSDVISMWVADMDFRSPEPVIQALIQRATEGIYGYPTRKDGNYQAVIDWLQQRHGWETQRAWQVTTPGVVPGLIVGLLAFTQPGDKVVVQPPVYHPFFKFVVNNGRQLVENPLIEEDGHYRMDFQQLEQALSDPRVRMLILCSPHNPVGRVWSRDELKQLGEICLQHGVLILSDEIHSDLVFSWAKHTPLASISEEIAANTVTFLAPSKTFNLAGLHTSVAILSNPELKQRYSQAIENLGVGGNTVFGLAGLEVAYREGKEWLDQLLIYLEGNLTFMDEYIRTHIPRIKVRKPEGTYLAWLDCRSLGLRQEDLKQFMIHQAGLGLDNGTVFGAQGEGFMRINVACPRAVLGKALEQLTRAVDDLE